jgi:hypothetical protein
MAVHRKSNLELGPYSVNARHEYRIAPQAVERKKTSERSHFLQNMGVEGSPCESFNSGFRLAGGINVNTRITVAHRGESEIRTQDFRIRSQKRERSEFKSQESEEKTFCAELAPRDF